jgi:hypothetical protein
MLSSTEILRSYDLWSQQWHDAPRSAEQQTHADLRLEVERLHWANFELWHEEDKARAPRASDAEIAAAKRAIDAINQRRNDQMERCDALLLQELAAQRLPRAGAELHSESPGLMLDRLSILSLKMHHTREEVARTDAPAGHAERNRERLEILQRQREDLAICLDRLWTAVLRGERRFTLYRQLKMYNDPALNPAIYKHARSSATG